MSSSISEPRQRELPAFVEAENFSSSQKTTVQNIFEKYIAPQQGRVDVFKLLDEKKYLRCRLLTINEAPSGVLVIDTHKRRRYEPDGLFDCITIEHLHAIDIQSLTPHWAQYLIHEAVQTARGLSAKSVSIKVSNADTRIMELLKKNHFRQIRKSGSDLWLYGKNIEPLEMRSTSRKRERENENGDSSSVKKKKPLSLTSSSISMKYLNMIKTGRKTIEGRIAAGMFGRVVAGQDIQFFCQNEKVLCRVERVTKYPTFREMLENEGVASCLPDETNLDRAANIYANIKGYPERERQSGVVAIELRRL